MVAIFFFGLGNWVFIIHIVSLAMDNGLSASEASALTMYLALGGLVLRVPAGVLADALGRIKVLVIANACLCLLHVVVVAISGAGSSKLVLTIFAIGIGAFNGAHFTILPAVPSELRLPKRFSNIMSVAIWSPSGLGCLAGPPIAGVMRTAFGSYRPAMLFAASCSAAGCALLSLAAFLLRNVSTVGGNGMAKVVPSCSTPLTLPTEDSEKLVFIVDGENGNTEEKKGKSKRMSFDSSQLRDRPGSEVHKHLPLPQELPKDLDLQVMRAPLRRRNSM